MQFPLSISELSLLLCALSIILLITSELLVSYSQRLGYFLIDKKRLRLIAIVFGMAFVITILVEYIYLQ